MAITVVIMPRAAAVHAPGVQGVRGLKERNDIDRLSRFGIPNLTDRDVIVKPEKTVFVDFRTRHGFRDPIRAGSGPRPAPDT
jgi:hypothetical protein